jgi:hypothetical protein
MGSFLFEPKLELLAKFSAILSLSETKVGHFANNRN